MPRLQSWLERETFIDLIKDLCDGLFMAMRDHVSGDTKPSFVIEKTPVDPRTGARDFVRKREVYPDGWYRPAPTQRRFRSLSPASLASSARGSLGRRRERRRPADKATGKGGLAFRFVRAMRERDASTVAALTAPSLGLELHGPEGDLALRGDDARDELAKMAEQAFGRRYFSERWVSVSGPSER